MDTRELSIAINVAVNTARDLAIAHYNVEQQKEVDVDLEDLFKAYLPIVRDAVLELHGQGITGPVLAQAEARVVEAFPGTTEVTNVTQHPAYAGPAQNTPTVAPAPIPGATDEDADWRDLVQNPGNWFDNRNGKQNPKAPDFRHKTKLGPDGKYKLGLWLDKKAPAWARQHFGLAA